MVSCSFSNFGFGAKAGWPRSRARPTASTMAVTAEDVIKAFEKAKAASADAEGNTASEDRCVDVLGALAKMPIPLKMFVTGALGEVPKGIKKWAKKGPTDKIRAAAESCVTAWKAIMNAAASDAPAEAPAEAPASADAKVADGEENAPEETDLDKLLHPALGDPLRDRTRRLLAEAIALCVGEPDCYASVSDAAQTACAIESAMHSRWTDTGKEYKAKVRQLAFNLKDPKNPDLRRMVGDGHITPQALLDYSPEQLASNARRDDNAKIREHATNEAVRGQRKEASTDAFKCGKCKQRKCTYYQLQTRSADEPMTTFVTCVNCDNRWKFC